MSLSMKDNHNPECDALNEFKSTTASVVSLYESGWQVQPDDPFTENKLLPTDVVDRWQLLGIVTPVENKEGLSLCTWWSTCRDGVAKSTPPQYTVTSPWNKPTPIKHFVNDDSVPASAACGCSLSCQQMPACLPHPLTPFRQIIIFRDVAPIWMTVSHDTHLSAVHILKMTDQEIPYMCSCSYIRSWSAGGKYLIYMWNDEHCKWASMGECPLPSSVQTLVC